MPIQKPEFFSNNDSGLFIDFRLDAIVDGIVNDFTGRKEYTIEFFREDIGFGITDVSISINTSLMPTVEITFKDMYGNTLFGNQSISNVADYSAIFKWPPAKFIMTFKGYLGKQVTWLLNMKDFDINFISKEGHYELKARFVPNQWGFFADVPFKYLLAVKGLRYSGQQTDEIQSIYDLINIGNKVLSSQKQTNEKYSPLRSKLNSLLSIAGSIANSSLSSNGEVISGVIDGKVIPTMKQINIPALNRSWGKQFESVSSLQVEFRENSERVNNFISAKAISKFTGNYEQFIALGNAKQRELSNDFRNLIESNIKALNEEIEIRSYETTKTMVGQITIGQIMSQLAKDSAYIIGGILEAGFTGAKLREGQQGGDNHIGKGFPLAINDGSEIPAYEDSPEMNFVRRFVTAIVDGVVEQQENQASQSDDLLDSTEGRKLKGRINNLEILGHNPYAGVDVEAIIINLIQRSGIAGFLTRSNDPNLPGDYDTLLLDRDSPDEIKKLADLDFKNFDETIISSLREDVYTLKRFVTFIRKFISDDGKHIKKLNGENEENSAYDFVDIGDAIPEEIIKYNVIIDNLSSEIVAELNTQKIISDRKLINKNEFTYSTPEDEIFSRLKKISGINQTTATATQIVNNGVIYFRPLFSLADTYYIVFDGDFVNKISNDGISLSSSDSDAQYSNEEDDFNVSKAASLGAYIVGSDDFSVLMEDQPLGVVKLESFDGDLNANKIASFNYKLSNRFLLNYSSLIKTDGKVYSDEELATIMSDIYWTESIQNESYFNNKPQGLAYTVAFDFNEQNLIQDRYVFGLFSDDDRGNAQRVFLRRMCDNILDLINNLERKKLETVNNIVGSSSDVNTSLYKQFHSLFNQWSSIAFSDSLSESGTYIGGNVEAEGLAEKLRNIYGLNHIDIKDFNQEQIEQQQDGTFFYDFPLQRIRESNTVGGKNVNVRNAIINTSPLNNADHRTTVLQMMYNLCEKNNFLFLPIPGYPGALDVKNIYKPSPLSSKIDVRNFFHVMWMPTPESRPASKITLTGPVNDIQAQKNVKADAFEIWFGSPDNQIVKNVSVNTRDNKVTAESIINLERLVNKEDQNKVVTQDCSILEVMAGRSYMSKVDILGNSQIFPMQFYFLENMPLFGGLYQILKVDHSITPNDMSTSFEGIRMRFDVGQYAAIPPITTDFLEERLSSSIPQTGVDDVGDGIVTGLPSTNNQSENEEISGDRTAINTYVQNQPDTGEQVNLGPYLSKWRLSSRLKSFGSNEPISDNKDLQGRIVASKGSIISNLNNFIQDVLEPFAEWLYSKDQPMFKQMTVTSAARRWTSGNPSSQHVFGEAVDIGMGFSNVFDGLTKHHKLFNYIMEFHSENPDVEYGQLLLETRKTSSKSSIWIHWSYRKSGANQKQRLRFANDSKISAPMNTNKGGPQKNDLVTIDDSRMRNLLG